MERKFKLQENYWIDDQQLGWIGSKLNGKTFLVLFWINLSLKYRRSRKSQFKISWKYIGEQTGMKNKSIVREVNTLLDLGIFIKLKPGIYYWNGTGIEKFINLTEEPIRTEHIQEIPKQEPVVIRPISRETNEMGLFVDEHGNILF